MRLAPVLLVGLMLAIPAATALSLPGLGESGELIVGVEEGALGETRERLLALGGSVVSADLDLGFLVVKANDVSALLAAASALPAVEYVEINDATRMDATQWSGAQWNAVEINGAQWNGAQWNDAEASGAQWNGAQWNGEQWESGPDFAKPDPGRGWQWGLERVHAPDAWNATEGTNAATLCVLDTGVDLDHPDLAANLAAGRNVIDPSQAPDDDAGHGTHIAGIAAAVVGNGHGVAGVGNLDVLPVKVLDADGTGRESDLATGLAWCANAGADVAVMALGVDDDGPTVRNAIAYARERDVLLLASAGNGGCDGCVNFPARHPDVIAVGAVGLTGNATAFSARGGALDLAAPGQDILSTFAGGEFRFGTGTSQAVAFAAGVATLLRDAEPDLSASETRDRLHATAEDAGKTGWDSATGHGVVDAAAAIL